MKRIAAVSIIVENKETVMTVNGILHEYEDNILGRMGLPMHEYGISVITLVCIGDNDTLSSLSGKLGRISGIKVKVSYSDVKIGEGK